MDQFCIVFGLEGVHVSGGACQVIDIAAVAIDAAGREVAYFQSLVKPSIAISEEALNRSGLSMEDFQGAPSPETAAAGLSAFLGGYKHASLSAFNMDRAKRLLGAHPWNIKKGWSICVREMAAECLGSSGIEKLYDAAVFFKIPTQVNRRALSDARISAEMLGKMTRRMHNVSTNEDFLREAEFLMEEGL